MPRGKPKAGFRMTEKRKAEMKIEVKSPVHTRPDPVPVQVETDEQICDRLNKRFHALSVMSEATVRGHTRSFIVSGPAGLGKSFGVETVLKNLEKEGYQYTIVRGFIRGTGLYKILHQYRNENQVVVFDDADSVFGDEQCLNMIKTACDMTDTRKLSWLAETKMQDEFGGDMPRSFLFNGSVIFITNYDFDGMIQKGHRLSPHFEAMISRSHYLDLTIKTRRDYIVRIKQVVYEHGMLEKMGYNVEEINTIIEYVEENADKFRELSLRMVMKLAGLLRMAPNEWEKLASQTCMK